MRDYSPGPYRFSNSLRSFNVLASAAGLSLRQRFILGKRKAMPDLCRDDSAMPSLLPAEAECMRRLEKPSGWVGVRTATPNHRCYAKQIEPGLFASLGHGSHGIASAAHAGEHLAALITGGVRARESR